jgi:hypothetical protein
MIATEPRTAEESASLALHATHRWADVTTYSSKRRTLLCLDCGSEFAAGPVAEAFSEPIESDAFFAEKHAALAR